MDEASAQAMAAVTAAAVSAAAAAAKEAAAHATAAGADNGSAASAAAAAAATAKAVAEAVAAAGGVTPSAQPPIASTRLKVPVVGEGKERPTSTVADDVAAAAASAAAALSKAHAADRGASTVAVELLQAANGQPQAEAKDASLMGPGTGEPAQPLQKWAPVHGGPEETASGSAAGSTGGQDTVELTSRAAPAPVPAAESNGVPAAAMGAVDGKRVDIPTEPRAPAEAPDPGVSAAHQTRPIVSSV